jgi:hypothetical protein
MAIESSRVMRNAATSSRRPSIAWWIVCVTRGIERFFANSKRSVVGRTNTRG